MTTYNKLVRDRIPEIIAAEGTSPKMHIASEHEFIQKLQEKLKEEVDEFLKEPSEEELADILEVINALCEQYGFSADEIEAKRLEKKAKRGGFSKRIILEES